VIQFNKAAGQQILELGGGDNPHPSSDVRVDIRPGPHTHFTADFDEPLPIGSAEFDGVYCQFVIEHLSWRKVKQFCSEMLRVLKPGGKAIIITANVLAQMEFIKDHPQGWDNKDAFESFSCVIFGDQDYADNTHKNFMTPDLIMGLLSAAGFESIQIMPYGDAKTDMLVQAMRPMETQINTFKQGTTTIQQVPISGQLGAISQTDPLSEKAEQNKRIIAGVPREQIFDKHYFNGGSKYGGYAREGLWDFPVHNITAAHILSRKPESVLEIGAGRGYIVKRIQDVGIPAKGLEISKHCFMTRACNNMTQMDVCKTPWQNMNPVDLAFSIATFEHLPEEFLSWIFAELKKWTKRGLHGIDFGGKDDGFDKTHVTLRSREWWRSEFDKAGLQSHEIVDKEELERGEMPIEVKNGDGKLKINLGSFTTMSMHGWQNLDIVDLRNFAAGYGYHFVHHDLRNGLPMFGTETVDRIAMVHCFEHFDYKQGLSILKECKRVLRPDGVMRIQVPDAALLVNMIGGNKDDALSNHTLFDFDEINDGCAEAKTDMGKLYALLGAGHLAYYDAETLGNVLTEAGFKPVLSSFRDPNTDPRVKQIIREAPDTLPALTLYMNGFGS